MQEDMVAQGSAIAVQTHQGSILRPLDDVQEVPAVSKKAKNKKTKSGKSTPLSYPVDPPAAFETPELTAKWERELSPRPTHPLPPWGLLNISYRSTLGLFRTEGCRRLQLRTPRLCLRQVEPGDLKALERIKTEPKVQRTQLYGSPSASDCKESFLTRYIRSSIPRGSVENEDTCRDDYIFAITLTDPASTPIVRAPGLRISSRISSSEGYIGNIALSLEISNHTTNDLFPKPGKPFLYPSFTQTSAAGLKGNLFYELHPQLWGVGLMTEAFEEVLRFAFEEVGCEAVISNPTTTNPASIKLCTKNGLVHTHTNTDNPYNKPQAFYEISRVEWWRRNRGDIVMEGVWTGKELCRWCMNFRRSSPTIQCKCGRARYCSRECQRADWVLKGGHQSDCGAGTAN